MSTFLYSFSPRQQRRHTQQKKWTTAIDEQRVHFEHRMEDMRIQGQGNGIAAARELEFQKQHWQEQHALETKTIQSTLETIAAKKDSELYTIQKKHDSDMQTQQQHYEEQLRHAQQGATHRLSDILTVQQATVLERNQWKSAIEKTQRDFAAFKEGAESQRLKLATATQTIEGLKYQVTVLNTELLEKSKDVVRLNRTVQLHTTQEEEVHTTLSDNRGCVEDATMQLTAKEASDVILTLSNRIVAVEQKLSAVTQEQQEEREEHVVEHAVEHAVEHVGDLLGSGVGDGGSSGSSSSRRSHKRRGKKIRAAEGGIGGFRHFHKFSYMPDIVNRLSSSLTSCDQLADTLYFLREAPGWMRNEDDRTAVDETAAGVDQDVAQWKNFDWEKGWTAHVTALSAKVEDMGSLFRSSVTTFRAELIQRKQYEELMCLHFYNREQHWKALYEAMVQSVKKAQSGGSSETVDVTHVLSIASKKLSNNSGGVERCTVGYPVGLKEGQQTSETEVSGSSNGNRFHDRTNENRPADVQMLEDAYDASQFTELLTVTPGWLPKGLSTSGGAVLERSAVGATMSFLGDLGEQFRMPQRRRLLQSSGGDSNVKGWTPIPPEGESPLGTSRAMRRSRMDSWDSTATGGSSSSSRSAMASGRRGRFRSSGQKKTVQRRKFTSKNEHQQRQGKGFMVGGTHL